MDTALLLREENYKDGILDGYYEYQYDPSGKMIRDDYYNERESSEDIRSILTMTAETALRRLPILRKVLFARS